MMRSKTTTTAVLAAGMFALAGCSSSADHNSPKGTPDDTLVKVATRYQVAANSLDWRTACTLSTPGLRGGTVAQCAARNLPASSAGPSSRPTASPSAEPLRYADGSTPEPVESSTPTGPARGKTGPVRASDVISVPEDEDHPAGYGVLVTFTVTWPEQSPTTERRALRLVRDGGAWLIDQHEDVQDGDMGHGSPVRAALTRG
ncbi:hypothetical protein [Streptomyces sp. NPDC046976]|uniref:hypothetical protein n=1 Tax=Streptomyces sp. NPDC046976 TaxID=3155258 RepID=UPI0034118078